MKYEVKDCNERYFAGIECEVDITLGEPKELPKLWDKFLNDVLKDIPSKKKGFPLIGLECYPPDFMESKVFDYYALVETEELIKSTDDYTTKKLPKGKYISFEVGFDTLYDDIQKVYKYIKEHNVNIQKGLDFEEYLEDQKYYEEGAILNFSFLLKNQ
jgi:predicted transcriptional regulator YdeE